MKLKIIPIAIILMILISPFAWAAGDKVDVKASDKKIDTKIDEGKIIDKTKESKKDIVNVPKELDGKIKVKDSDTSKYRVEKTDKNSIKISKEEVAGEHTKTEVSVDTAYLTELDKQANADGYIGYMRKVDGQVVDVQKIKISDISSGGTSTIPATFSEVIVSGFSGTKTTTFYNVTSGQTLDIQDGAKDAITVSVVGTVPTYVPIVDTDVSTYPSGAAVIMPMNSSANIVDGISAINTGVTFAGGKAYFDGSTSKLDLGTNPSYSITGNISMVAKFTSNNISKNQAIISRGLYSGAYNSIQYQMGILSSAVTGYGCNATVQKFTTGSGAISSNVKYSLTVVRSSVSGGTAKMYSGTSTLSTDTTASGALNTLSTNLTIGRSSSYPFTGTIDLIAIYPRTLSTSEIAQIYAGGSGVSFKPSPSYNFTGYNVVSGTAKTLDIDSNVTSVDAINTAGTTLNSVTVVEYFTEDTTKISDTTNATAEVVHISHSSPSVKTAGTIAYQVAPLYSGTPALVSNNPNATVTRNATSFIVSTGYLPTGTTYNYTVTVANDNNHGMWLNRVLQWMGSGFGFVGEPPTDYTTFIGDQIEVTVS